MSYLWHKWLKIWLFKYFSSEELTFAFTMLACITGSTSFLKTQTGIERSPYKLFLEFKMQISNTFNSNIILRFTLDTQQSTLMKALLGFALLLAATVVMCQEETDSYIVLLKEGATDEHLEDVIQQMEKYSSQSRDEMSIESENSLLPVLFGEFNEEVAEFVSCSNITVNSVVSWTRKGLSQPSKHTSTDKHRFLATFRVENVPKVCCLIKVNRFRWLIGSNYSGTKVTQLSGSTVFKNC